MKFYQVNGVRFGLSYLFKDFFEDNIEKYEIEECEVQHTIETKLVERIIMPPAIPNLKVKNREVYINSDGEEIYIYDKGCPVLKIKTDSNYEKSELFMVKDLNGAEELEYVYTGILFMELCLFHSIQSIHGSAINYDDQVIIFSGPSATGKSTHVEYWKEINPFIEVINDDKPLLSIQIGELMVSGSPWSGKTKVNSNVTLPLHSIVFLEQGKSNVVKQLSKEEKMIHIMRNINRPRRDELWEKVSDIIELLIEEIPMYSASVTNSIEAALVVKKKLGVLL